MPRDVFVRWVDQRPSKDDLRSLLEDYVGDLAAGLIRWDGDRFFVTLHGRLSFAYQRVGPATVAQRTSWTELSTEVGSDRVVEVWIGQDCINVMTRHADQVTNDIAHGFAVLAARAWNGTLEGK